MLLECVCGFSDMQHAADNKCSYGIYAQTHGAVLLVTAVNDCYQRLMIGIAISKCYRS